MIYLLLLLVLIMVLVFVFMLHLLFLLKDIHGVLILHLLIICKNYKQLMIYYQQLILLHILNLDIKKVIYLFINYHLINMENNLINYKYLIVLILKVFLDGIKVLHIQVMHICYIHIKKNNIDYLLHKLIMVYLLLILLIHHSTDKLILLKCIIQI